MSDLLTIVPIFIASLTFINVSIYSLTYIYNIRENTPFIQINNGKVNVVNPKKKAIYIRSVIFEGEFLQSCTFKDSKSGYLRRETRLGKSTTESRGWFANAGSVLTIESSYVIHQEWNTAKLKKVNFLNGNIYDVIIHNSKIFNEKDKIRFGIKDS